MEFNIPKETDITIVALENALKHKPQALSQLSKAFEELHIDRLLQAYGDMVMVAPERAISEGKADFRLGQEDMLFKIKKLLSNLYTISNVVNQEEYDVESLVGNEAISPADLLMVQKLKENK